jgi:hypothetical protein
MNIRQMRRVLVSTVVAACMLSLTAFFAAVLPAADPTGTGKAVESSSTEKWSNPNAAFDVNKDVGYVRF